MTEKERDKVLHGLNSCGFVDGIPNVCGITECPYRVNKPWCTHELTHDAGVLIHELLTAQEPRLVTEADFDDADKYGWLPAWCETKDDLYCECILIGALKEEGCRYWTSRPTKAEREATAWE